MIADAMQFVMYDKRETIEIEEDYDTKRKSKRVN
jgi:hypothetical protein